MSFFPVLKWHSFALNFEIFLEFGPFIWGEMSQQIGRYGASLPHLAQALIKGIYLGNFTLHYLMHPSLLIHSIFNYLK